MRPTQRSLELLRRHGWRVCVVEQRLPIPGKSFSTTRDAFGFADVLAIREGTPGSFAVQVTDRSSVSAHIHKVMDDTMEDRSGARVPNKTRDNLIVWLRAGNRFEIHGWDKGGARGETKAWRYRRVVFHYHGETTLAWHDEEAEQP